MGRTCTVCSHKDVDEINRLLLTGTSFRDIAGQFDLSKTALARHKESHIPELLLKSEDIKEVVNADNLLAQLQEARTSALDLLDKAIAVGRNGPGTVRNKKSVRSTFWIRPLQSVTPRSMDLRAATSAKSGSRSSCGPSWKAG